MVREFECKEPESLHAVAESILESVSDTTHHAFVVALHGDLGAGKTRLVQELASLLGVTEPVTSPTFTIMRSYEVDHHPQLTKLVHIDAYRLETSDEAYPLQLPTVFSAPHTIVCVEWPERLGDLLPANRLSVVIEVHPDALRHVVVRREE